ncbi:hypothetical protein J4408_02700, partial [Candidatus Pacearchaeota archaeon]|nr:hypothetical protein [Candidatus Pacearchaeota archaeon]
MKKIGFVSLGTGGTMGHMTLITNLSKSLSEKGYDCTIFTEYDYEKFSNVKSNEIKYVKLKNQEHTNTIGGCLIYRYAQEVIELIKKNNIKILIFSTIFDIKIIEFAKSQGIKTMLISYPLRDSHREIFTLNGYSKLFDKIYSLKDLESMNSNNLFENEVIVLPSYKIENKYFRKKRTSKEIKILVTCGGGGRPSSTKFFEIITKSIEEVTKSLPNITFTILKGSSNTQLNLKNCKVIDWSTDFKTDLDEHDFVISEAGYFTVFELMLYRKTGILIPGARRIDNQELRAIIYEKLNC